MTPRWKTLLAFQTTCEPSKLAWLSRDLLSDNHCIVVQFPSIRSITKLGLICVLIKTFMLSFTFHLLHGLSSDCLFT